MRVLEKKNPRTWATAVFGLLAFWTLSEAFADNAANTCGLSIQANGIVQAWSLNAGVVTAQVTVSKSTPAACRFALGFTRGSASNYDRVARAGGGTLRYQVYADSGLSQVLKSMPEGLLGGLLYGKLEGGAGCATTFTYYFNVPLSLATTPVMAPFGNYTDSFKIEAFKVFGSGLVDLVPSAITSVLVQVNVPRIIDLSLVAPGAAFNEFSTQYALNFGAITAGAQQGVDIKVRSNAGFRIYANSMNRGAMVNGAQPSQTVPYSFLLEGSPQDLTSGGGRLLFEGGGQTATTGVTRAVSIVTSDPEGKLAGSYSDVVTLTAATIE